MSEFVNDSEASRRHFHTFDALRFLAVFKVFLQHMMPVAAFPWFNYVKLGGYVGVYFFFVLSGFLITYIICSEKQQSGTINLKNFFARRVLRIWPLFYLVVALCYILPPVLGSMGMSLTGEGYEPRLGWSLLFLENYRMIATGDLPNVFPLAVTWSLCIEEHFYIIWGLLLYVVPLKHLPKVIGICLLIGITSRFIFVQNGLDPSDILTHIDLFAYGAIPAWLLIKHEQATVKWVTNIPKWIQAAYIPLLLAIVLVVSQYWNPVINATLFGCLFSFLLVLILPKQAFIRVSDKNIFSRLGVYTYGIYLYHIFIIAACRKLFEKMSFSLDEPLPAISFVIVCLVLTICCSYLSYRYFEKPFLKLKKYFRKGSKMESLPNG